MALLRFSHAYRSAGAEFTGAELPDHLAVVCEFAATTDLQLGLRLLQGLHDLQLDVLEVADPAAQVCDLLDHRAERLGVDGAVGDALLVAREALADGFEVGLGALGVDFTVAEPLELIDHVRALSERYGRAVAAAG